MSRFNQKQITEQAKFTYSALGKAFEKHTKTITDQREKQIKAIQNQGQVKTIKDYAYNNKDSPWISKEKEIFSKLADERLEEITELDKKVSPDHLIYRHKGPTADVIFNEFDNVLNLLDKTREGEISLAGAKNDRIVFKSHLGKIKKEIKYIDQKSKKMHSTILKCFIEQGTLLLNFMMIILQ